MTIIREQIEDAIRQIVIYKKPNLAQVTASLSLLIKECELGNFGKLMGEIVDLEWDEDEFLVVGVVDYRRDSEYESFYIPISVIDAPDPIAAAKVYAKQQKIWNYENWIASWTRSRDDAQKKIDELTAKLEELKNE